MAGFDKLTTGFDGFPNKVRSIPVPNPVFGQLLEQIDDLAEMKATLRVIWLLHEKKGFPRLLTLDELLADRTLVTALSQDGQPSRERMERALSKAVERGTLISGDATNGEQGRIYMLNTESDRNALARMTNSAVSDGHSHPLQSGQPWEAATERPNIYALYEDNIGLLSPLIAEELREAEQTYPIAWIEDAFRESVAQNKRSWRYIARILERWEREGRRDGKSGRYPSKKAGYY